MRTAALAWAFTMSLPFDLVPGAVMAATLARGVRGGVRGALGVRVGALAGTVLWAALACAGAGIILGELVLHVIFGVTGAGILAWQAWRSLTAGHEPGSVPAGKQRGRQDIVAGAVLVLASPLDLTFWVGMNGAVPGLAKESWARAATLIAGFALADLVCTLLLLTCVILGRRWVNGRGLRWVYRLSAVGLLYCGVTLLCSIPWRSGVRTGDPGPLGWAVVALGALDLAIGLLATSVWRSSEPGSLERMTGGARCDVHGGSGHELRFLPLHPLPHKFVQLVPTVAIAKVTAWPHSDAAMALPRLPTTTAAFILA